MFAHIHNAGNTIEHKNKINKKCPKNTFPK